MMGEQTQLNLAWAGTETTIIPSPLTRDEANEMAQALTNAPLRAWRCLGVRETAFGAWAVCLQSVERLDLQEVILGGTTARIMRAWPIESVVKSFLSDRRRGGRDGDDAASA